MGIFVTLSTDLTIENINLKDLGMWGLVSFETNHVIIRNVNIHSPYGPTRDGIDIVDGHHVLIDNCTVYSEDDSICLKSGSAKGVYDVTVQNSHVVQSSVANALKLGTATTGYFKKILFENIKIDGADKAALAVESLDGAAVNGVTFKNIQFKNAGSAIFVLLGKRGNPPQVGSIQNLVFENVQGHTKHTWGSAISGTTIAGTTYSPQNLSFKNVHVTADVGIETQPSDPPEYQGQYPDPNLWGDLPSYGFYFRHVKGMSLVSSGVTTSTGDVRKSLVQEDVH
jgi:polygalacturonase